MADIVRFKDIYKNPEALSFKDMYVVEYRPGEDELTNYRAVRRKRLSVGGGNGGPVGESTDVEEALNMQQRMKRSRLMKRLKSRIKIGRERAKRKMADKKKLERRSMRKARDFIVRRITKDIPKKDLSFARKQEIEKKLDKPAMQARIQRLARKMFPKVRKAEVERKKG
jgi:hypothetical protein